MKKRHESRSVPKDVQTKYLLRMLQMDPTRDAAAAMALRRRAFKIDAQTKQHSIDEGPALAERRVALRARVAELQTEFWKVPLSELQAKLDTVEPAQVPELRPTLLRLRAVTSCRDEFLKLASSSETDQNLIMAFKAAAVLPANKGAPFRERFLQSLQDRERLHRAQSTVIRIRNEFPTLYQVERDWFDTLLRMKDPESWERTTEKFIAELPTGLLITGGIIIFVVVFRLLLAIVR